MTTVYLDHNATTATDPQVLESMMPWLREEFGNPSSSYPLGRRAHDAIETAREQVARLIGARPDEIVFTSGGTESSNIAIRSGARAAGPGRRGVVTTNIEHPATDACCALLAAEGFSVQRASADATAIVPAGAVATLVNDATALVTVIHAQNEIGTLQPVAEIAAIAHRSGALMHIDAAQSLGKVALDVNALGVDLVSIAGHKLYAPKGIGALFVRSGLDVPSVLVGAGQEHGRRPGTENVAFIVGLGEACRVARARLAEDGRRIRRMTDTLLLRLQSNIPDLVLTGDRDQRLPNTLNLLFPGVSGRQLLAVCPKVTASVGSACHADREEPSAILSAIGIPPDRALGAIRLSVGRHTTSEQIELAAGALIDAWRKVRSMHRSPSIVPTGAP